MVIFAAKRTDLRATINFYSSLRLSDLFWPAWFLTACVKEFIGRFAFIEAWQQNCGKEDNNPHLSQISVVATLTHQQEASRYSLAKWQQPAPEVAPISGSPSDLCKEVNTSNLSSNYRGCMADSSRGFCHVLYSSSLANPQWGVSLNLSSWQIPPVARAFLKHPPWAWGREKSRRFCWG